MCCTLARLIENRQPRAIGDDTHSDIPTHRYLPCRNTCSGIVFVAAASNVLCVFVRCRHACAHDSIMHACEFVSRAHRDIVRMRNYAKVGHVRVRAATHRWTWSLSDKRYWIMTTHTHAHTVAECMRLSVLTGPRGGSSDIRILEPSQ